MQTDWELVAETRRWQASPGTPEGRRWRAVLEELRSPWTVPSDQLVRSSALAFRLACDVVERGEPEFEVVVREMVTCAAAFATRLRCPASLDWLTMRYGLDLELAQRYGAVVALDPALLPAVDAADAWLAQALAALAALRADHTAVAELSCPSQLDLEGTPLCRWVEQEWLAASCWALWTTGDLDASARRAASLDPRTWMARLVRWHLGDTRDSALDDVVWQTHAAWRQARARLLAVGEDGAKADPTLSWLAAEHRAWRLVAGCTALPSPEQLARVRPGILTVPFATREGV